MTGKILTPEVIEKICTKLIKSNEYNQLPITMLVESIGMMAQHMRAVMPMLGDPIESSMRNTANNIFSMLNNKYSTFDILSGKGLVGSYFFDHIEIFQLCTNSRDLVTLGEPDIYKEYREIFDYSPRRAMVDNLDTKEYGDIKALMRQLQLFGFVSQFFTNPNLINESNSVEASILVDQQQLVFSRGKLAGSGIYSAENNGYRNKNLLLLRFKVKEVDTVALISLGNRYGHNNSIHYYHEAEKQWVKNSDNEGYHYLEGTYEALREEAEKFLNSIGYSMDVEIKELAQSSKNYLCALYDMVKKLREYDAHELLTPLINQFSCNDHYIRFVTDKFSFHFVEFLIGQDVPNWKLTIESINNDYSDTRYRTVVSYNSTDSIFSKGSIVLDDSDFLTLSHCLKLMTQYLIVVLPTIDFNALLDKAIIESRKKET